MARGCLAVIGPDGKISYRQPGGTAAAWDARQKALHPRDDLGRFTHDPGLSVLAGRDSLAAHTGPDGKLDPQRQALHERIIERVVGGHQRQAHPRALFLGGGPASGKTTVMRDPPPDAAQIACDDIKADLPEYKGMVAVGDLKAGEYVQEESKRLKERALAEAADRRVNILLDSTGDTSYGLMESEIARAHRKGYDVVGKYVTVDADEAVRRSMERAKATGRMVPEETIRQMHAAVSDIFARLVRADLYDEAELWDNNVPQGQPARLVGRKLAGGSWEVLDQALWQRFLAKAEGGGGGQGRGGHRAGAGGDPGRGLPGGRAGHAGEPGLVRPGQGRPGGDGGGGDRGGHPRLAKFNPDEPRDQRGRWTGEGAGLTGWEHYPGGPLKPMGGEGDGLPEAAAGSDTACVDCGAETLSTEPGVPTENYMVRDEVWRQAGMEDKGGYLCIGSLERRLGRRLTPADFPEVPVNDLAEKDNPRWAWSWRTPRLVERISGRPARP